MDIREFGDRLIRSGDLDPVYIAIHGAKLPEPQLCRLLFAYWCFYHLGVAAWMSEHEKGYWDYMLTAAFNNTSPTVYQVPSERWPRGSERRHFRGESCVKAIDWFSLQSPESWVRHLAGLKKDSAIIDWVAARWPMFGPWIGFKAADMLERVYGAPIEFNRDIGLLYESPKKALMMLLADPGFISVDRTPRGLYDNLLTYFSARRAPPGNDRLCGPQEVETVLCKWGSMRSGYYHVGKDITEVRLALLGWGETARRMLNAMPAEIERQAA